MLLVRPASLDRNFGAPSRLARSACTPEHPSLLLEYLDTETALRAWSSSRPNDLQRAPDRVNHLVLIEPTLLQILPRSEREAVTELFLSIIDLGRREGDIAALRVVLEWSGGEAWSKLDEQTKVARLQALVPLAQLVTPHGKALLTFYVSENDVQSLRPPTLLVYGTNSFDPHPAIRKRWRELRPDLEIIVAEGASHNVHRDRPEVVNSAILSFLSKC